VVRHHRGSSCPRYEGTGSGNADQFSRVGFPTPIQAVRAANAADPAPKAHTPGQPPNDQTTPVSHAITPAPVNIAIM
jgi:hypothetical protein